MAVTSIPKTANPLNQQMITRRVVNPNETPPPLGKTGIYRHPYSKDENRDRDLDDLKCSNKHEIRSAQNYGYEYVRPLRKDDFPANDPLHDERNLAANEVKIEYESKIREALVEGATEKVIFDLKNERDAKIKKIIHGGLRANLSKSKE